jgi:hypothetical protein
MVVEGNIVSAQGGTEGSQLPDNFDSLGGVEAP